MAVWQVEFEIVPDKVLRKHPGRPTPEMVAHTRWWHGVALPRDYRSRLDTVAAREASSSRDRESWGDREANGVEIRHEDGAVQSILARVDVRRLDARFAAALLVLVRELGAALVRRDGIVVQPTIGAFGAALRGSAAWGHANDPAAWLAAQGDDDA